MPQIDPIRWLLLFIIFSITFILFCSINYYSYEPTSAKSNELKNINLNSINWKW